MDRWRPTDLHAYVDDCLPPGERQAFEARMAANPALARRAAQWRAQNKAIRLAFSGEAAGPGPIDFTRRANKPGKGWPSPSSDPRLARRRIAFGSRDGGAVAWRISDRAGGLKAIWPRLARGLGLLALSAVAVCASATGPSAPPNGLSEAGLAAFAAFALPSGPPAEFATRDLRAAERWLTGRLPRPLFLPALPSNLNLVGARIAPASRSAAAFLILETDRSRLGLLVQSLDAPSRTAPQAVEAGPWSAAVWTDAGQGFVLVGDLGAPPLRAVAAAIFDAPYGFAPPIPERGS